MPPGDIVLSSFPKIIDCQDIQEVLQKLEEVSSDDEIQQAVTCITDTDAFAAVCLNKWVLQTAFYQYHAQYSQH